MEKTCKNCRFWYRKDTIQGDCRRRAPRLESYAAVFPPMDYTGSCGEWEGHNILYLNKGEQTISVSMLCRDGILCFDFTADCGKFGTDEGLAEYEISPVGLLHLLQDREAGEEC